jgi:hypothetical protein
MRYPILFLLSVLAFAGCKEKDEKSDAIVFSDNEIYSGAFVQVCNLDESETILGDVKDFAMVNDTAFVVVDGQNTFLYNTAGEQLKQLGYRGRGNGEMLAPSHVAVTPENIYVSCGTLLRVVAFSHGGDLQGQYSDFARGIHELDADDRYIYLYTSGYMNKASSKTEEVLQVYDMQKDKMVKTFGERNAENEVMSTYANSGGICALGNETFVYAHPAYLDFFRATVDGTEQNELSISDKDFKTEKIDNIKSVTDNHSVWWDYLRRNSAVRDIIYDDGKVYVVAETGAFPSEAEGRKSTRKTKVYILSEDKSPLKAITYDFVVTPSFRVMNDKLYFISTEVSETSSGNTEQSVSLNYFPLD